MTDKEIEQEKQYREMGEAYLDRCTKSRGFVILPQGIRNDLIDMYVAGAIEAVKKEKIKTWHDLRKNPEDLPEIHHEVFNQDGDKVEYDGERWMILKKLTIFGGVMKQINPPVLWCELPEV